MNDIISFGAREIELSDIFSAGPPTGDEMAAFCNSLKMMIESHVNILESLQLMTKSTEHPWLISILYFTHDGLCEGNTITGSISIGFKKLIKFRMEELNSRETQPGNWREIRRGQWAVPDFFGYFADLLSMIDVGEETGSLDTALENARDMYLGKGGYGEKTWGRDIAILNRTLAIMFVAGLPLHSIARVFNGLPALQDLQPELEIVADTINDCDYLFEAFAQTNGRLSDPVYLGLIEAGEKAGAVWSVFDGMSTE